MLRTQISSIFTNPDMPIASHQVAELNQCLNRRRAGEPLAYILNSTEFWGLRLRIDRGVFIPRPDTETLVEHAVQAISPRSRVLDLGTGSGAVALAIRKETAASVVAADLSVAALRCCHWNACDLNLQIDIVKSNWFASLSGQFDVVVCNPPYIARSDPHLSRGDLRLEPKSALQSGHDGLDAIRHISQTSTEFLHSSGCLLFEHGDSQSAQVRQILESCGYSNVTTYEDVEGRPRVTAGTRS